MCMWLAEKPAKTLFPLRSSPLRTFREEERETYPAARSEEKRLFSQATSGGTRICLDEKMVLGAVAENGICFLPAPSF